jgi:hypothetical protein
MLFSQSQVESRSGSKRRRSAIDRDGGWRLETGVSPDGPTSKTVILAAS